MATIQVQGHQFVFDQHGETVAAGVNNLGGDFLADLKEGQPLAAALESSRVVCRFPAANVPVARDWAGGKKKPGS